MALGKVFAITATVLLGLATAVSGAERKVFPSEVCLVCKEESTILYILKLIKQEDDDALLELTKALVAKKDCLPAAQGVPYFIMRSSKHDPQAVLIRPEGYNIMLWSLDFFFQSSSGKNS